MADSESGAKLLQVRTRVSKCKLQIRSRSNKGNRNRAIRRRRRKLKYIERSRKSTNKGSQSLRNTLAAAFNITDMTETVDLTHDRSLKPPQEVADWQYNHQLAYWKSRAISLEYENRMLHAHIKKMCTQEIKDYVEFVNEGNECAPGDETQTSSSPEYGIVEESNRTCDKTEFSDNKVDKKVLYGELESKINAMETAMKVNYNLQLDRHKPQLWPNIPLNL